jgi:alpha-tubulin suppressor-like RCC1 family protein
MTHRQGSLSAGRVLLASQILTVASAAMASGTTNGIVFGWGENGYSQNTPPVGLSNVTSIAAGGQHSLALTNSGRVIGWGFNAYGQCLGTNSSGSRITSTPTGQPVQLAGVDLNGIVSVASGYYHSVALRSNGSVVAWGYNGSGQCLGTDASGNALNSNTPNGQVVQVGGVALSAVTAIASKSNFTLALKSSGQALAWGENGSSQCSVPNSAVKDVSSIAAGDAHAAAVLNDGTVIAWGYNNYGQCLGTDAGGNRLTSTPAGQRVQLAGKTLTGIAQIAAGSYFTLALKSDGTVVGWGENGSGQCLGTGIDGYTNYSRPNGQSVAFGASTLSGVVQIDCGGSHSVARMRNGTAIAWGSNGNGQCLGTSAANGGTPITSTPSGQPAKLLGQVLSNISQVCAGNANTIALKPFRDCQGNGIDDFFDIRDLGAADLNFDGVPDVCQGAISYDITSPSLGVPTANAAATFTFSNLVMPDNFADVPVTVTARGDFDAASEYLTVRVNSTTLQRVFETGGVNCTVGNNTAVVMIPFATFAAAVPSGQISISLLPSPAVTASECSDGFMRVQMKYMGIGPTSDCNQNGLLDTRDIGANPSLDCDGSGHLDACELADNPLLDCNQNGRLDSCDIAAGSPDDDGDTHPDSCQYAKGDLDLNAYIDNGDVAILMLYFGIVSDVQRTAQFGQIATKRIRCGVLYVLSGRRP